jgi:hypothetical protein
MFEQEIARGMELLDTERPGWREHIDLGKLDMNSCSLCVLGQEFARETGQYSNGYTIDRDRLGLDMKATVRYGFTAYQWVDDLWNYDEYDQLTHEWVEALSQ